MAIIDVDRHILMKIVNSLSETKKAIKNGDSYWATILEVRDNTDALLFHSPNTNSRKSELKILRNKIFRASSKLNTEMDNIKINLAKIEALITHLVSNVEKIDTGKGLETDVERPK